MPCPECDFRHPSYNHTTHEYTCLICKYVWKEEESDEDNEG